MLKGVILIGGPMKGTRFRPLSLEIPKPLFPVAGFPMIYHHIEALSKVGSDMKEILLIGFYQPNTALNNFIASSQKEFKIQIRYLQEYTALGTAGGIYHFRDQILKGAPQYFFVLNADVCGEFPLNEMLRFHRQRGKDDRSDHLTILSTEATRQQSLNYGSIVEDKETHEVLHYVEKPGTFVSTTISCGIYLVSPRIFDHIGNVFQHHGSDDYDNTSVPVANRDSIFFETDVFSHLAAKGVLYNYHTTRFWSQLKSAGAAIYANRHYLSAYHQTHPERLAKNGEGKPSILEDVVIHSSAQVHHTAKLGPNVTIGRNVTIGPGVRIRESMILEGATIQEHSCLLYCIIGWSSVVGPWSRVEGTPQDPNPNKPFAKLESLDLFNNDGRLNPSITVIGSNVQIPAEVIVLNSIVLPHKDLNCSYKNQIIL